MPEKVASLKKQNDAITAEIDSPQKNFDKLQTMYVRIVQGTGEARLHSCTN